MSKKVSSDPSLNVEYLLRLAPIISGVRLYHQHSTIGLHNIPKGGVIIAANHSLASYDIALLMGSIYEYTNRIPKALIDRLFFKVPGLGDLMAALGSREGNRQNAETLLKSGEMLVVAPGGMREALRPSSERYKIIWDRRKGFAKLAIETRCPVVLAACPAADELYDIAPSYITAWAYKTFKVPVFFAKGLGFSLIPKPIRLTHFLSEPIYPPEKPANPEMLSKATEDFHQVLVEK
ncbi:MAG: lysophospholipid acyltransferase family protein, partial [Proteobacteria bacterium]|nr:lysophospholipid acyltransferase family protein [Pseudomonadota bacterium]